MGEGETKGTWKGKCIRTGGGTKYECREEGRGGRPMSTTKAIVRHLLNSSSLPRYHPRHIQRRGKEGARKRKLRAPPDVKHFP